MNLAQKIEIQNQSGSDTIQGPLKTNINSLGDIVNIVISFLIPFAGAILLIVLIMGGYSLMLSRGDPEKVKAARQRITTGLIGFGILITAYLFVRLVSQIFGLGTGIFGQ